MLKNPLSDVVSNQYERWIYPAPILDLPQWLESNWQWFDPAHSHHIFWPDRDYWPGMDVLVAGCGTNQAAIIAYTNPEAQVVAIDVSQSSLNHHLNLKNQYALENLEIHRLAIEDLHRLNKSFDLIISTGVLHHLADPQKGLDSLCTCLRKDGTIALMLYARYGRMGLEMVQSIFKDMELQQNDKSLRMVKDALSILPNDHPIRGYLNLAPDLEYDAGLIDTFLHGREKSYTIEGCINFVETSGLVFQDLFFKAPYYSHFNEQSKFLSAVAELPERQQWSIIERIYSRNACHFFMACRSDRATESYQIDFKFDRAMEYIPTLRLNCGLNENCLFRPDWKIFLEPNQIAIARHIDGNLTIRQIVEKALPFIFNIKDAEEISIFAMKFFQSIWKLDFISMRLGQR